MSSKLFIIFDTIRLKNGKLFNCFWILSSSHGTIQNLYGDFKEIVSQFFLLSSGELQVILLC